MNLISKFTLALILLLYAYVGVTHSSHQGFWHDEIYTLTFLKGFSVYDFEGSIWSEVDTTFDVQYCKNLLIEDHFVSNFSKQILHEGQPPFYFILLKIWSYCFGSTEVALRSFSLCCGILTFLVFFNLFRRQAKRKYTAWVVLLMLIINPFLFYFFTEARMYALALLLATLSFSFWIKYSEDKKIRSYHFLFFCLSSIGLMYTHYYGAFFLSSLAFYELIKNGFQKTIFNHAISILCFLPWGIVIKQQLKFHDVHWTDGIVSFGDSISGYFKGITHLLISPIANPSLSEQLIILALITLVFSILVADNWKFAALILIVIGGYGIQIYLFDQLVDHHTILVPRYYSFAIIFIYWAFFKAIDTSLKVLSLSVATIYCIISSIVLIQIYKLDRAPKQMFRELAGYVDLQIESDDKVLVFEPKGPVVIGVAYYLKKNFKITFAENPSIQLPTSAVYIDEMLGVPNRENKYHTKQQENLNLIPFVGVFLYE